MQITELFQQGKDKWTHASHRAKLGGTVGVLGAGLALASVGSAASPVQANSEDRPSHTLQINGLTLFPQLPFPEIQRQEIIQNTRINDIKPGTIAHPITVDAQGNERVWSYGFSVGYPAIPGERLRDNGVYGSLLVEGGQEMKLNLVTNPNHMDDYIGTGARAATWIHAGPHDAIEVRKKGPDGSLVFVGSTRADLNGFGGILFDKQQHEFEIRLVRYGNANPIRVDFGNISHADAAKPLHPSVIDTESGCIKVISNGEAPLKIPITRFSGIPIDKFFYPITNDGEYWSHAAALKLPQNPGMVFYDQGNSGEFFVRGISQDETFDMYFKLNQQYIRDYTGGKNERFAFWVDSSTIIDSMQLLDENGNVVRQKAPDGSLVPVQVTGPNDEMGLVFPETESPIGLRISLKSDARSQTLTTRFQFGSEPSFMRGSSYTIDATKHIQTYRAFLPRVATCG